MTRIETLTASVEMSAAPEPLPVARRLANAVATQRPFPIVPPEEGQAAEGRGDRHARGKRDRGMATRASLATSR